MKHICMEQKQEILQTIEKLEKGLLNLNLEYVFDFKLPSLSIWTEYQKYLNEILTFFKPSTREDYNKLAEIVTELKLDEFYIDAKEPFEKNKETLLSYIKKIKQNL